MGLLDNITEFFAPKTYVQAASTTVSSNELENSIRDLNRRYKLGYTTEGSYIKFGVNDDFL